jgi:hypothetical protein
VTLSSQAAKFSKAAFLRLLSAFVVGCWQRR